MRGYEKTEINENVRHTLSYSLNHQTKMCNFCSSTEGSEAEISSSCMDYGIA